MDQNLTRRSLLARVRDAADLAAWNEFEATYRELITRYARARGLQPADADDVCQSVLLKLFRSIRSFEYDASRGRFRAYLHRMVKNEIVDQFARPNRPATSVDEGVLHTLAGGEERDAIWEREWENHHFRLAMQTIRRTFEAQSVEIFDRLLAGEPVDAVATAFATTSQAVHKIKQRVRDRMKELIARQVAEEDDHAAAT